MKYVTGLEFLQAAVKILGLGDRPLKKMIIVADIEDAVQVYYQELMDETEENRPTNDLLQAMREALAKGEAPPQACEGLSLDCGATLDVSSSRCTHVRHKQPLKGT